MALACDRPGDYRGIIVDYGVKDFDGGSVAIAVTARLDEYRDPETGEWTDWSPYDIEAEGMIFVIKKDGQPNESQVEALVKHANWPGTLESAADKTWEPTQCQFSVEEDTYKGNTRFRISWINDWDSVGGGAFASPEKVKQLANQHGAKLRALAGSFKRNTTAPASKAPAPSAPPPKKAPPTAEAPEATGEPDTPF